MPNMLPNSTVHLSAILAQHGWQLEDEYEAKVRIAKRFVIHVRGVAARNALGLVLTGSAGSLTEDPLIRAHFELIERILLWESALSGMGPAYFPEKDLTGASLGASLESKALFPPAPSSGLWQYARSNGVACHESWAAACQAAAHELIERDRVLASWFGYTKPILVTGKGEESTFKEVSHLFRVVSADFGTTRVAPYEAEVYVRGLFLFPYHSKIPLIYGFGSGFSRDEALAKASREACQRLGFLWGEEPRGSPRELRAEPLSHQEFYLAPENHHLIERWLAGQWYRLERPRIEPSVPVRFFDLRPPGHGSPHSIVKAASVGTLPLTFGLCDVHGYEEQPLERRIHPIV